jgi:hypothetical protein
MSAIENISQCINELRSSVELLQTNRKSGSPEADEVKRVRRNIIKLRRAHAKMREHQTVERKEIVDVVRKLQRAKLAAENAQFLEAQCEFLVRKFQSAQFPELEKVSSSLPSVEEYTRKHMNDPGFVSYESDPHQFTLNMLSSELEERDAFEQEIKNLGEQQGAVKKDIASKRDLLSSLSSKLLDASKAVESLVKVFEKP